MTISQKTQYDAIIVGGGFFGTTLAVYLKKNFNFKVLLIEKETDLLQHASYNNQARVHNGYHYPRCFLTARRSNVSFPRFIKDFKYSIVDDFEKIYLVGKKNSKVSAKQFKNFMKRVGAPLKPASENIKKLFNPDLVEEVFSTTEVCFDAKKLKEQVWEELKTEKINVQCETKAMKVEKKSDQFLEVSLEKNKQIEKVTSRFVFNCTYSQLNELPVRSGLKKIRLKHELTEMPLIHPPKELKKLGITMMCGPFFSLMPFPDKNCHVLSHVRYTPHHEWWDEPNEKTYLNAHDYFKSLEKKTNFPHMIRDVERYLPSIKKSKFTQESIWEVKTILPMSEEDDGRPILFKRHDQMPEFVCIMGGKIDNIYDIPDELTFLNHV